MALLWIFLFRSPIDRAEEFPAFRMPPLPHCVLPQKLHKQIWGGLIVSHHDRETAPREEPRGPTATVTGAMR